MRIIFFICVLLSPVERADRLISDRKPLLAMLGLFELVHERDGVIFHRDAALLLFVGDEFIRAEPEFGGSLARLKVSRRRQVGPVDIRCLEYVQGSDM